LLAYLFYTSKDTEKKRAVNELKLNVKNKLSTLTLESENKIKSRRQEFKD
jgi:hypothetical protein